MTDRSLILEICVDDPVSLAAAIDGDADRIELCSALALGGLSPSPALATAVLALARGRDVAVYAMVRPRAGDFAYTEAETDLAVDEARALLAVGVDGLVFGAARDGRLDGEVLSRWIAGVRAARSDVRLTLHRAVDTVDDPVAAVREARGLGFERVLTSGGAPRAVDGVRTIAAMVAAAGDDVAIMAGSGIDATNVATLVEATGVRQVHASASRPTAAPDARVAALGFADPPRRVTDVGTVRALRDALDRYGRTLP